MEIKTFYDLKEGDIIYASEMSFSNFRIYEFKVIEKSDIKLTDYGTCIIIKFMHPEWKTPFELEVADYKAFITRWGLNFAKYVLSTNKDVCDLARIQYFSGGRKIINAVKDAVKNFDTQKLSDDYKIFK